MTAALDADQLVVQYGRTRALDGCSVTVPRGCIAALVGPNGAGKTTLLHCGVGLLVPRSGSIRTLGDVPRGGGASLRRVGFVAQDTPLYRGLSVADHLRIGRRLNHTWDDDLAHDRLRRLGIPLERRCGTLSGGQRAQVALTLALGRCPELLILDEPVASLDPLARREFLQGLMEAVADHGLSVLLSSHIVADLERVCDHLIVMSDGRVQVDGNIETLLSEHRLLVGPRARADVVARGGTVVDESHTERQSTLVVRGGSVCDPRFESSELSLEDLVLAYLRSGVAARVGPTVELGVPA